MAKISVKTVGSNVLVNMEGQEPFKYSGTKEQKETLKEKILKYNEKGNTFVLRSIQKMLDEAPTLKKDLKNEEIIAKAKKKAVIKKIDTAKISDISVTKSKKAISDSIKGSAAKVVEKRKLLKTKDETAKIKEEEIKVEEKKQEETAKQLQEQNKVIQNQTSNNVSTRRGEYR